jgi:hypothetical protein
MPVDQTTQRTIDNINELAARMLIAEIAWAIIGTMFFFGMLYLTLRYAIRDGIKDAQRDERRTAVTPARPAVNLPDMRAD